MSDLTVRKSNIAKSRERIAALKEKRKSLKERMEQKIAILTQKERRLQKDLAIKLFEALEEAGIDFYSDDCNGIAFVIGATINALENPSMHDTLVNLGESKFIKTPSLNDSSSSSYEELEENIHDE